jgi:hypothetical protein
MYLVMFTVELVYYSLNQITIIAYSAKGVPSAE